MRFRYCLVTMVAVLFLGGGIIHADQGEHADQNRSLPNADASAVRTAITAEVEILADELNFPSSVELDDEGNVWVALSGAGHGNPDAKPAVLRHREGSKPETVIDQELVARVNDLLWHKGTLYISHRGKVSAYRDNELKDLVTELPSKGDHTNNQIDIGPDGKLYITQGSATNSGVVGADNIKCVKKHPDFHDMLPKPVKLVALEFESKSFLDEHEGKTQTSAFMPFGETREVASQADAVEKVTGQVGQTSATASR